MRHNLIHSEERVTPHSFRVGNIEMRGVEDVHVQHLTAVCQYVSGSIVDSGVLVPKLYEYNARKKSYECGEWKKKKNSEVNWGDNIC